MSIGTLAAIWRYPVKSLAAEPLDETAVTFEGLPLDRHRALFVRDGHLGRLGKTYRGKENELLHTLHDEPAASALAASRGITVDVCEDERARFFDAAPVSLIFDCWIDEVAGALGEPLDPRRWRPNFYVRAANGFGLQERELVGATIAIGSVTMQVRTTIKRCVTTTYDIATGERWDDVLTYVAQRRDNEMGVYCDVLGEGAVRAGDAVELRAR